MPNMQEYTWLEYYALKGIPDIIYEKTNTRPHLPMLTTKLNGWSEKLI
jgi:hypothetical protein